jgi:hypothetical protein
MKYIFTYISLLIQMTAFSQSYFSIKGHVTNAEKNDVNMTDCKVSLISSSGSLRETTSDSIGFYHLDSIPVKKDVYEMTVSKKGFFSSKQKIKFSSLAHDTVINFEMVFMIVDYYWLPDIHFNKNTANPEKNFKDTLSIIIDVLQTNPSDVKIKILGHKDSSETCDKRKERAQYIYDELIKAGISKDRLLIEASNKPSYFYTGEKDYNTASRLKQEYTEKYIASFPLKRQNEIRQLNECVSFEMTMK